MSKNITDRLLLKKIYDIYYSDFCSFDEKNPSRSSQIYVPIDCELISKELGLDKEIIFGRLYYHLDRKYGYKQDDGSLVSLFTVRIGGDKHAVNFPLLSAVLAELEQSYHRFTVPLFLSMTALLLSILSFITSNN